MSKIFFLSVLIISLHSCITSKMDHHNQISIKEADRILLDVFYKVGILASYDNTEIFNIDIELDKSKIIFFDTTKIKKLDLNNFPTIKKIKRIKLANKYEINQGDTIKGYWTISFNRSKDESFYIWLCSGFYIPKGGVPIEIDGNSYIFVYRIINGKAELIRWRG